MPNPPVAPHLFLIVPGHLNDCIAALLESKYPFPRETAQFVIAYGDL